MTAQLIALPFRPTINLRGGLEAGALLDVYATGTTTRVTIYSDVALSVELSNPLEADSLGVFPDVYFDDTQTVRVRIRQANGTVLSDTDPYVTDPASAEASADAAAISAQIAAALSGPLYTSTAEGIAATSSGDEFAVDNSDGTAGIYVNSSGTAVLQRTIIIDPIEGTSTNFIGTANASTGGADRTVRAKLDEIAVSPEDFGAVGNGTTDDTTAFDNALAAIANGGTLRLAPNKTYKVTDELALSDDVCIDLNGSTIAAALNGGNTAAVAIIGDRAKVYGGTIDVTSTGTPGSQSSIHAPVRVGRINGDAGTVASKSAGAEAQGWYVGNLTVDSDKVVSSQGAAGVAVVGGCHNGLIENITVPDTSTLFGAVMMDWSYYGTLDSAAASMATNKTAFNAGTMYTIHPHNIVVRNVQGGAMTLPASGSVDVGSHFIRLSAVYNIRVENCRVEQTTYASYRHTVGDVGAEFAPAAQKPLIGRGVVFDNCTVEDASDGWYILTDSLADNVQTAVDTLSYVALTDPLIDCTVDFVRCVGASDGGASVKDGIRVIQQRGGRVIDCQSSGFLNGIGVDDQCERVSVLGGIYHTNRNNGVYVDHATNLPKDIIVEGPYCYGNGTDGTYSDPAGVFFNRATRPILRNARLGNVSGTDSVQDFGYRVGASCVGAIVEDVVVYAAASADSYVQAPETVVRGVETNIRTIGQSGVSSSHTGDTTETTLRTVTVPANSLGANGALFIEAICGKTGTTAASLRIKINGTTIRTASTGADASVATAVRIYNANSVSGQVYFALAGYGSSGSAIGTGSFDTTSDLSVAITGQLGTSGDSITLVASTVQVVPAVAI